MAFADREVQYPGRVKLTPVSGTANVYDMERQEGEVYEEGTILNAENLNNPSITSLRVVEGVITDELAGVIQMFAGSTAPNGWLICNGAAVSRSDYATLFRVIGPTYGAGDGSTTFNLPDLRGRFPIGVGNGTADGHTNHTLSQKGGNENAVVVTHTHAPAANGYRFMHAHQALESGDMGIQSGTGRHYPYQGNRGDGAYWGTGTTTGGASGGVSGTGKNMPPYITLNFIIHAGVPTR